MFSFLQKVFFRANNEEATPKTHQKVSVNLPLPEDLLIVILSYVPPDDLFNNCAYVEEWNSLIHSQSLWSLKCQREGKIPKTRPNPIPYRFYQYLYFAPFGKNLLKNPCGQEQLKHWARNLRDDRRDYPETGLQGWESAFQGWVIENPPQGADELPNTECQSCFATTHYWCEKGQVIDLWEAGFSPELFKSLKPIIYVCEWYAARFDCGSEYELEVKLLDDNKQLLDIHKFRHVETQWTGRAWSQTEHEFKEFSPSVRYVYFVHRGKDTQFWAGSYGSKMAEGKVIVRLPNQ